MTVVGYLMITTTQETGKTDSSGSSTNMLAGSSLAISGIWLGFVLWSVRDRAEITMDPVSAASLRSRWASFDVAADGLIPRRVALGTRF